MYASVSQIRGHLLHVSAGHACVCHRDLQQASGTPHQSLWPLHLVWNRLGSRCVACTCAFVRVFVVLWLVVGRLVSQVVAAALRRSLHLCGVRVLACVCVCRSVGRLVPSFGTSTRTGMVLSGAMGSIFATDGFGLSVGYPLTLNGAFLVNLTLTFFVYREIQGKKNIILFLIAAVVNITSVVLLSFAKT